MVLAIAELRDALIVAIAQFYMQVFFSCIFCVNGVIEVNKKLCLQTVIMKLEEETLANLKNAT